MRISQEKRILSILEDGAWHCSSEFYSQYMADPRARICGLKKKGHELESRKCRQHSYHEALSKEWKLSNPRPYKERILKLPDGTIVSKEKVFI